MDPIRLSSDPDAVTVIASPEDPRHHGRQSYGELRIGQAYIVDKAEAQRLMTVKGFAPVGDPPKKPARKPDPTDPTPQE
jgi:hypothetical protein